MLRFPFIAALAAALVAPVPAAAELLVAPTRVVLTPETRSTELVLATRAPRPPPSASPSRTAA